MPFPQKVVTGTPQVLVADGLTNTFDGARFQFEDLQLTVCRGQKLGLVGINGCGKSTLLKVIFGSLSCCRWFVFTFLLSSLSVLISSPL